MPNYAFTLWDCAGILLAALAYFPLVFVPGYVLGWAGNLLGFRRLPLAWRILAACPLSIAFTPILVYWSRAHVWPVLVPLWLAGIALALGAFGHESPRRWIRSRTGIPALVWVLIALWIALCLFALADIKVGDRLYLSAVIFDHTLRTAVTDAITRTGVPPANPYFALGGHALLRYHYFWMMMGSVADGLSGGRAGPRNTVSGGVIWAGIALACMIPLYLRFFEGTKPEDIRRRSFLGLSLFAVTGVDVLAAFARWARTRTVDSNMEGWNEMIASWSCSIFWEPHYIAGLVACLVGFLLIWYSAQHCEKATDRQIHALFAGVAFGSAVGCSVYITIAFAGSLVVWGAFTLWKGWYRHLGGLVIAGLLGAALALPYLHEMSGPGGGGSLLVFSVRNFGPLSSPIARFHIHSGLVIAAMRLAVLPLNYFMELGFFFVVGVIQLRNFRRRGKLLPYEIASLCLVGTVVVLCTFLRSGTISNNDFGWRGFLIAQFILLLWGIRVLESPRPRWGTATTAFLVLGVTSTVYQFAITRAYYPLADAGWIKRDPLMYDHDEVGKRAYASRAVYEELRPAIAVRSVVQNNPAEVPYDHFYGLFANRQSADGAVFCGTEFGGDVKTCNIANPEIASLFSAGMAKASAADAICDHWGIDVLIVKDVDPVWEDRSSWIWKRKPIVSNPLARAMRCGNIH
jgi:hypothetical protein